MLVYFYQKNDSFSVFSRWKLQFDDSYHRIPWDPVGKHRKSLEHGSSIPTGNFLDFFRWISVNSVWFPAGIGRTSSEKTRKFSGRNTASTKSPELPGTGSFWTGLFDLSKEAKTKCFIKKLFMVENCVHHRLSKSSEIRLWIIRKWW